MMRQTRISKRRVGSRRVGVREWVTTRPFVLRANTEVAVAEGKTTQAIRLLEEFRSEFEDTSAVLGRTGRLARARPAKRSRFSNAL